MTAPSAAGPQTGLIDAERRPPARNCVLVLAEAYLPGYKAGGLIRSIANLVDALGGEFDFRIVTLDRDLGDKVPFSGVVTNQWVRVGQADVMYLQPGLQGWLRMAKLLCSVDSKTVLYLNSFFSRRFSILPMLMWRLKLSRPRRALLAPRGEFSLGALRLKHWRKLFYIRISRWLRLYQGLIWHVSSDFEARDLGRQFPALRDAALQEVVHYLDASGPEKCPDVVVTASDLAAGAAQVPRRLSPKRPGQLRAVFVGRCSPMKNLSGALQLLAGISGDVSFDIYGPAEDAQYWERCRSIIATLPANIRAQYRGGIEHANVAGVFCEHDLLLLPTLGESYGHVISEALASGCPVLISDQTPWRNLEAEGVGWDLPLDDTERFRSVLQRCVDGDEEWHAALSRRAAEYAVRRQSDTEAVAANRRLFALAFALPTRREVGLHR